MIVTIDIGNSRIKQACWQNDEIVGRGALVYEAGDLVQAFDQLLLPVGRPDQVYALCVAGEELAAALQRWCKQHWQLAVIFLKTEKQFGNIINAYADPQQHGVDRWAALVAGVQRCPDSSICVLSAGTAVTFDLVDKNGRHMGGYILPSYVTMRKALLAETANVASASSEQPDFDDRVPDNTGEAVNQGLHILLQAGIRQLCQLALAKLDDPVHILVTGGFAGVILKYPDMPPLQHEPDLVMQGLFTIMSQRNISLEG